MPYLKFEDFNHHINKKLLYYSTWKFNKHDFDTNSDLFIECQNTENMLSQWAKNLLKPAYIYRSFSAYSYENKIVINFPEKSVAVSYCSESFNMSQIGIQLVTLGKEAVIMSKKLFEQGKFQLHFYWHGYCATLTEALAEHVHRVNVIDYKKTKRLSFGYPALPSILEQIEIVEMLAGKEIDVEISQKNGMLVPEYSTCALVL